MKEQSPGIEIVKTSPSRTALRLIGSWTKNSKSPALSDLEARLSGLPTGANIALQTDKLESWDSTLLTFVLRLIKLSESRSIKIDTSGLPEGAQRLLRLATAVPERGGSHSPEEGFYFLRLVGRQTVEFWQQLCAMLSFLGESSFGLVRFAFGRSRVRWRDLFVLVQDCGPSALPIVTLISALVGLILAYIGAIQLEQFGAQIYVANLVGIAMAREMGPIMAGIILAGRTGAAFAAQLGTMQVNEEIDALQTMGISPMEFLVVPRMLALMLMMPLLCVYADVMGVAGGALVSWAAFDISLLQFFEQVKASLKLQDIILGVIKSVVFAVLVAVAGCLCGIRSGRSASAVGEAVTSAVVYGIVSIVVADAIFAVITGILGL